MQGAIAEGTQSKSLAIEPDGNYMDTLKKGSPTHYSVH